MSDSTADCRAVFSRPRDCGLSLAQICNDAAIATCIAAPSKPLLPAPDGLRWLRDCRQDCANDRNERFAGCSGVGCPAGYRCSNGRCVCTVPCGSSRCCGVGQRCCDAKWGKCCSSDEQACPPSPAGGPIRCCKRSLFCCKCGCCTEDQLKLKGCDRMDPVSC